jgi:phosphonate transport system substrate-binding protein
MRFGRIDLAYFGPASYTIAKDRMRGGDLDIEPFAARMKNGATTYQSVIIANAQSGIEAIADIKGRDIDVGFGDPASTSSHFAPKYTMMQMGVMPQDYTGNHLGSHDAVAVNVARGNAQVGGLSRPILESMIDKGMIDPAEIRVLAYSDPLPQYPWVMRTDLSPELRSRVREAFHSLERGTEAGDGVLEPFGADGFADMTDADYDIIRDIRAKLQ